MKACAKILNTFTPQVDYLEIEKDGAKVRINSHEFRELMDMMNGKKGRVECSSDSHYDDYNSEYIMVWLEETK